MSNSFPSFNFIEYFKPFKKNIMTKKKESGLINEIATLLY